MKGIKRFVRRDTEPALSGISEVSENKQKERRKSVGVLKIPETIIEPSPPPMPKYYYQGLDRDAAETLLRHQPVGTFLVRDRQSSTLPGSYTLSLRNKDEYTFGHYRIETNPINQKLEMQVCKGQFDSVESLVNYFIRNQRNCDAPLKPYIQGSGTDNIYEEMDENNEILDHPYQEVEPPPVMQTHHNSVDGQSSMQNLPSPTSTSRQSCYENMLKKGDRPPGEPPEAEYENLPAHTGGTHTPTSSNTSLPPRLPPKPSTSRVYQNLPDKFSSLRVEEDGHRTGLKGGHRMPPPPLPQGTTTEYGKNTTIPYPTQPGAYENWPGKDGALSLQPKRQSPITGTCMNDRRARKVSLPPSFGSTLSNQGPPPLPARPHVPAGYENLPGKGLSKPSMVRSQTEPERRT